MPLSRAEASASFQVYSVTVTLAVNKTSFKPGETLTFSGLVTGDGEPVSGVKCYIQLYHPSKGWTDFVDADVVGGAFSRSVTVPFSWEGVSFPCRTWRARARCLGAFSGEKSFTVYYPTRIRGLSVSPSRVMPGGYVRVTGYLEKQTSSTTWTAVATKQVDVYLDGTLKSSPYTGSDGRFDVSFPAPSKPGTYTVKAVFPGETAQHLAGSEGAARLTVPGAPVPPTPLVLVAAGVAVAGVGAWGVRRGWRL